MYDRNNSANTKVSAEGGGGGAPGAESPPQPVVQPMVRQLCPAPMEVHGGADLHLQPMKDPTLKQFVKNCNLWEGLTLEKFMEDCLQ